MIEGYLPGLVRVDPVGVAPAEVVRLAARCERLEAVAEAAREVDRIYEGLRTDANDGEFALWSEDDLVVALHALRPALVAAGATGKAGT